MSSENKKPNKIVKKSNAYLKYTGMVGQLLFLMLFAVLAGKKIDAYFQTSSPYFTASLVILFFVGFVIRMYYDLTKDQK